MVIAENLLNQAWDEGATVRAAQRGEISAFNQLVLKYQALIYNVAYRILQDENDATDATQTSLVKAYRNLNRFSIDNFSGWLIRIVVNASYDLLRLRKHHTALSLDEVQASVHENDDCLVDTGELPEAYTERNELNQLIYTGINTLHSEHRTILVLADIYGYSYQEIAQVMDWPLGTVKSKLSRARANLRAYLLRHPDLLPFACQPHTA